MKILPLNFKELRSMRKEASDAYDNAYLKEDLHLRQPLNDKIRYLDNIEFIESITDLIDFCSKFRGHIETAEIVTTKDNMGSEDSFSVSIKGFKQGRTGMFAGVYNPIAAGHAECVRVVAFAEEHTY